MKLVKEHINEKFIENSDPIKDMGIGLKRQLRLGLNRLTLTESVGAIKYKHHMGLYYFEIDYYGRPIERIIDHIKKYIGEEYFSKIGVRTHALHTIATAIVKDEYKHIFQEVMNMGENVNEKFEEESDPLDDMKIGTHWKEKLAIKFLNWVNKDYQMDPNSSDYWGYVNIGIIGLSDPELREGFTEYVHNWTKYRKALKDLNIQISRVPDIMETIFERPADYPK
jgi:hypothetical protein